MGSAISFMLALRTPIRTSDTSMGSVCRRSAQVQQAVDGTVLPPAAGMGFDAGSGNQEIVTRVFQDQAGVRVTGVSCQEAVPALQYRSRSGKPGLGQKPGADTAVGGPTGVQPLGPSALGQVF